jgi:hypothetical protein
MAFYRNDRINAVHRYLTIDGDVALIQINCKSGCYTARLDVEDLQHINWTRLFITGNGCKATPYLGVKVGGRILKVHSIVHPSPRGFDTDHINFDGLDNRKCNLRTLSRHLNRGRRRNNQANSLPVSS